MEKSFEEKLAEAKAAVNSISPKEASMRKVSEPETVFIDPRDASDIFATTGIIPGALNVTLGEISENADSDLPQELVDHSRSIITSPSKSVTSRSPNILICTK